MEFRGVPLYLLANLLMAAYLLAAFALRRRRRALRLLTAAFAAFALAYYFFAGVVCPRQEPPLDFASYYVTADDLLAGGNPYRHYRQYLGGEGPYAERLASFGIPDLPRPAYPPLLYLLISPLTLLPFPPAWAAWVGVNAGLGALALLLAGRAAGLRGPWPWVAAAAFAAVAHPTIANVEYGQANLVVAAFLFGGVLAWARGKEIAAGVLLAAAALIKLFPLVFLAYFVAARRWRAAAAFTVTAAAFAAGAVAVWGPGLARDYATFAVAPYLLTLLPYKLNASAPAFLAGLIDSLHPGPEPQALYYAILGSTAAAVLAGIIWVGRRRPAPAVAAAFLTTLALLANNWTLFHYLVLLALPFLVVGSRPGGLFASPRYGLLLAAAYLLVAWRLDFLWGIRGVGFFVPAAKTAGMAVLLGVLVRNETKKAAAPPGSPRRSA